MSETIVLGIDCGGTHTDAALLAVEGTAARLLASARRGAIWFSAKAALRFASIFSRAPLDTNIPIPLRLYRMSSSTSSPTPFAAVAGLMV